MKNLIVSNVSGDLEDLTNLKNTLITFNKKTLTSLKFYKNVSVISVIIVCMNKDRLIKHKSMRHSKTYTEEELYVDDIDPPEDDMKCNICEKEFPWLAISWDVTPMLIRKKIRKEHPDTQGTR